MSSVMVLCAGLGTRLRPLTDELPKPLVPIGDRSILGHIAQELAEQGFRRAVANTHHLPEHFAAAAAALPLELGLVHEPVLRGTAGGVAGARSRLEPGPVLVWNSDVLLRPPSAALLAVAQRTSGMCLAVAPRERGSGTIGLDVDGRVVRLRGEHFGVEHEGGDYVGVLALGPACLASLPEQGCLFGDWALPELRRGGEVRSVRHDGGWTEAGGLASYAAVNADWLRARGLEQTGYVAPAAQVAAGVSVRGSVVGGGARVTGTGELARCVVWPGARVTAPLADAVVTSKSVVVPLTKA